jgi:hypothetical protein
MQCVVDCEDAMMKALSDVLGQLESLEARIA